MPVGAARAGRTQRRGFADSHARRTEGGGVWSGPNLGGHFHGASPIASFVRPVARDTDEDGIPLT